MAPARRCCARDASIGADFSSDIAPAFGLDALSGFFLLVLAASALPALAFARSYVAAGPSPRALGSLGARLPADVDRPAGRPRHRHLPRLLGADDARPGRRDSRRTPRRSGSRRGLHLRRDHAPRRSRRLGRAARRGRIRGDRRPRGARRSGNRCSDARRHRRADRLRDEGRPRSAALLAAPGPSGGTGAHLRADVRRDDQGGALRADPRASSSGSARAPRWLGLTLLAHRTASRRSAACSGPSSSTTSSGCWLSLDRERRASSCSHSARRCCSPTPARRTGRRSRSRAGAAADRSTTRCFKALLFLGAGAFERAVGSLELDQLGGLLRRMPWTGRRVPGRRRWRSPGCLRSTGSRRSGSRSSRSFTSRSTPRSGSRSPAAIALAGARGDGRARAAVLREGHRPRAARPAAQRGVRGGERSGVRDARRRWRRSPRCASCFAIVPGLVVPALTELAPGERRGAAGRSRARRPGHRVAADARARAGTGGPHRRARARPRRAARGRRPELGVRAARRTGAALDLGRLHQAAATRARGAAAARARGRDRQRRRHRPADHLLERRSVARRTRPLRAGDPDRAARGRLRAAAADRKRAHVRAVPARTRRDSLLALVQIGVLG